MRRRFNLDKCLDVRKWVAAAIRDEERYAPDPLWRNAPSAEKMYEERLRRIEFLRKHGETNPNATIVADRLESCEPGRRCLSGACPECGRLFQRWFVRRSKIFIAEHIIQDKEKLIAISIVPWDATPESGKLQTVDAVNLQRRLKYALAKAQVGVALGGIDFSFDQDREGDYQPFWSPHFYFITSTADKKKLGDELRKSFLPSDEVPIPVEISQFQNKSYRRSYALKMTFKRRIGYDEIKRKNATFRKCRNTSGDKLRASERLELFIYLDHIGLADRVIFGKGKPVIRSSRVTIERC